MTQVHITAVRIFFYRSSFIFWTSVWCKCSRLLTEAFGLFCFCKHDYWPSSGECFFTSVSQALKLTSFINLTALLWSNDFLTSFVWANWADPGSLSHLCSVVLPPHWLCTALFLLLLLIFISSVSATCYQFKSIWFNSVLFIEHQGTSKIQFKPNRVQFIEIQS